MSSKRIAIVGSGCSAMGVLWALRGSDCTVHLYEAGDRLGGHTNTVPFVKGHSTTLVDAGFIAFNGETYPNFVRFLDYLNVKRVDCQMGLAFSRDEGEFEWAGTSIRGLFAQLSNIFRPDFWRMLFDVLRFNLFALDIAMCKEECTSKDRIHENGSLLCDASKGTFDRYESIGSYLQRHSYSKAFIHNYLIPILAATWCTRPDIFQLECPAYDVIRFMWNHHLMESINNPLRWYTICGGARTYIDRFMALHAPTSVFLESPVARLERMPGGTISLSTDRHPKQTYDHVILTTSAEISLHILHDAATDMEQQILSQFKTCTNTVYLHSDLSQMPQRPSAWSGWNYLAPRTSSDLVVPGPTVTFDMNTLQHIPRGVFGTVLFTMNPNRMPERSSVQGYWTYTHPVYSIDAIKAQQWLPEIQGVHGVSFAGAWTKNGFHEDGFTSGIQAAVHLLERIGLDGGPESCHVSNHERALPSQCGRLTRSARFMFRLLSGYPNIGHVV